MNNPIEHLLANGSINQLMLLMLARSREELIADVNRLSGEKVTQVGLKISTEARKRDIHAILGKGCMLFLYSVVTDRKEYRDLFANMEKELGGRTQVYRTIRVWQCFGESLTAEPKLVQCFCQESLKLLAAESVPESAREAALELARQDARIDIKQAKKLHREHSLNGATEVRQARQEDQTPIAAPTVARNKKPTSRWPKWEFTGKFVRVVVQAIKSNGKLDAEEVVQDLEDALDEVRKSSSKAG